MRTMKKYLALALALLLCLSALWGCGKKDPQSEDEDQTPQTDETLPEGDPVVTLSDTLECCDGERTLRFIRNEDGSWSWRDDLDFPLDNTYVSQLLTTVSAMQNMETVSIGEDDDEDLGLDDESKYVSASNEKGETVTWYLGDKNSEGRYYARIAGDENYIIYLAPAELTEQISRSIYDMMLLPQLPAIAPDRIRSITIDIPAGTFRLQQDSEGRWFAGDTNVTQKAEMFIASLAQPTLVSCLDYKPSSGALPLCGLEPYAARVTVSYLNTVDTEQDFVLTAGSARGEYYCVTIGEDPTIYLMDAAAVKPLLAFTQ